MLVAIGLVYLAMVILCALPLAVIGAFVVLAVTGHALDLSALIGLLMLTGIVVTNAIVLLALVQRPRYSAAKNASEKKRSWNGCCRLMGVRRFPQAKGDSGAHQARRRWPAARPGRPAVVAVEVPRAPGLHLARRHAPRRAYRFSLERGGDRAGDCDGCAEDEGAQEWLTGGSNHRQRRDASRGAPHSGDRADRHSR